MPVRDSEEVRKEREGAEHMAGIRSIALSEEARDARNAGRRLDSEDDEAELIGAVKKLGELIAEQRVANDRIASELGGMVEEIKDMLTKIEELQNGSESEKHAATQMALRGVANAQQQAKDITLKSIDEMTERNRKYLDAKMEESRKRIERLAMVTLPDRLFYYGKWLALMLVLIILAHILWQMMM